MKRRERRVSRGQRGVSADPRVRPSRRNGSHNGGGEVQKAIAARIETIPEVPALEFNYSCCWETPLSRLCGYTSDSREHLCKIWTGYKKCCGTNCGLARDTAETQRSGGRSRILSRFYHLSSVWPSEHQSLTLDCMWIECFRMCTQRCSHDTLSDDFIEEVKSPRGLQHQ